MRPLVAVFLLLFLACSGRNSEPEVVAAETQPPPLGPIEDLDFNDPDLQEIATELVREARLRGIHESAGETRVERLLALEGMLGGTRALRHVERLVDRLAMTDGTQWAKLRRKTESEFSGRKDDAGKRVNEMLLRWKRERLNESLRYLSSNYTQNYIHSREWERRFAAFLAARPLDAAAWGWVVAREYGKDVAAQYDRTDAESAYRYYLEFSGLGTNDDVRRIFSVPGIEIAGGG
jgi:hypothetical protein